jgi:DNA-directed RNA polymerase specialized sigma subunit
VFVPDAVLENSLQASCDGLENRIIAKDILHQIKLHLSEQQNALLYFKYNRHFSMKLIGNLFGVSEQRISQIHSETIKDIKKRWSVR